MSWFDKASFTRHIITWIFINTLKFIFIIILLEIFFVIYISDRILFKLIILIIIYIWVRKNVFKFLRFFVCATSIYRGLFIDVSLIFWCCPSIHEWFLNFLIIILKIWATISLVMIEELFQILLMFIMMMRVYLLSVCEILFRQNVIAWSLIIVIICININLWLSLCIWIYYWRKHI
jgi:hypothetical protein